MIEFPRVITAMITPFKDDNSVDYEGAQKLALHLVNQGSEGLVVSGTTGESPTLTVDEKLNLYTAVKEAVGHQGVVIAGTGTNSTVDCLRLTEEACKRGLDAIMVVVPYYNKPNQAGIYQHYKAVSQVSTLPVILYNVPGRTGINMHPETVAKLAELPNIVGIKEASGDLDQVSLLRSILPQDFLIFSGDDSLTLPMLALGGHGVISVAGHIVAKEIKEMIDSFIKGDVEKARMIHLQIFNLFKTMFVTTNPIPVKKAANLLNLPSGGLRLPLIEASSQETEVIMKALKNLNKLI